MDDARTVGKRHVIVAGDVIRLLAETKLLFSVRIQGFVFGIFVLLSLLHGYKAVALLPEHRFHERFGKNIMLAALLRFDLRIIGRRVHAKRDVGRQRPGRGRPREDIFVFLAFDLKLDENRRLLYVLIALCDLVRGERRTAARTVRNDFMPFIKQTLFVNFFQRPPFRFDIVVVIGDVRVVHIAPIAHAVGHVFPLRRVLPDGLFTFVDKRLDAVSLDFHFVVEAELLFHFQLHGQAVRVPARFSQNVFSLHRLITRHDIFHDAR